MDIEEKRRIFLKDLNRIENPMQKYVENLDSKFYRYFLRIFILKHKFFVKSVALVLKNVVHLNLIKNVTLFWGRKFKVFLADADASSLYFFGSLYGEEIKIIKFLINNLKEDDVFYDIGANYGFYTALSQEFISNGEIHSFEPHPQIFKLLKNNSRLDLFSNTFLNNIALSDKDGYIKFYDHFFDFHHSGASSLINYSNKKNKQIIVETFKLDAYIKNNKIPTIIKMDIEGGEALCLNGGIGLLSQYSPIIIMEFVDDDFHRKAINILLNNNYKMFQLENDGDISLIDNTKINKIIKGLETPQNNYVFKK